MNRSEYLKVLQKSLAIFAILFGALTVFAGTRVLAGADPGYVVFLPLLIFNTVMGFAYIAAGLMAWRNLKTGRAGALAILVLNLVVLAAIGIAYTPEGEIAVDSLRAMTLRAGVWLAILGGLWWLSRKNADASPAG